MRTLLPLAASALCAISVGCNLAKLTVHNLAFEAARGADHLPASLHTLAETAWADVQASHPDMNYSADYAQGFEEGYVSYLEAGGDATPPPIPPRRYWTLAYKNPDGYRAIEDWFVGFKHGVSAAHASGLRPYITVPTSVPPPPDPLAFMTNVQPENSELPAPRQLVPPREGGEPKPMPTTREPQMSQGTAPAKPRPLPAEQRSEVCTASRASIRAKAPDRVAESLCAAAASKQVGVRQAALRKLQIVREDLCPLITTILADQDPKIASKAVAQLELLGEAARPAAPVLVRLIADHLNDPRWTNQIQQSITALGNLRAVDPITVTALTRVVQTDDPHAIAFYAPLAAEALGKIGAANPGFRKEVVTSLVQVAGQPVTIASEPRKSQALLAIGRLGSETKDKTAPGPPQENDPGGPELNAPFVREP